MESVFEKWHGFKQGINLSYDEINEIVELLLAWLHKEFDNFKDTKSDNPKKKQNKSTPTLPLQLNLF